MQNWDLKTVEAEPHQPQILASGDDARTITIVLHLPGGGRGRAVAGSNPVSQTSCWWMHVGRDASPASPRPFNSVLLLERSETPRNPREALPWPRGHIRNAHRALEAGGVQAVAVAGSSPVSTSFARSLQMSGFVG
jgi:hypothetical protein